MGRGGGADPERDGAVAAVRIASLLALGCAAAGVATGLLANVADTEPLLAFSAAPRACTRAHWKRSAAASDFWSYETHLELGRPARTIRTAVRFDVTLAAALRARGVAAADADAVVDALDARLAAQQTTATGDSDNAVRAFGALLVASEELAPSLSVEVLVPSRALARCVTPLPHVPVSVCEDALTTLNGDPNAAAPEASDAPIAFLAIPQAFLGLEAQRRGLAAELFLESGSAASSAAYSVSVGAATLCFEATGDAAAVPSVRDAAVTTLAATRNALTGALEVPAAEGGAASVCEAPTAASLPLLPLLPASSSDPVATLGATTAIGLNDEDAFRASTCGADVTGADATNVAVLACAASAGAACVVGDAVVPLASVSERAFTLARNVSGHYALVMATERSDAYTRYDELVRSLLQLALLLVVSVVVEARARLGVSGPEVLTYTLNWAIAARTAVPTSESGAAVAASDPKAAVVHHYAAAMLVMALRVVQLVLTFEARLANRLGLLTAIDAVSIGLNALITGLRLGTRSSSQVQELSVYGGSTYLGDTAACLLATSVTLPRFAPLAQHGFEALMRFAAGGLLLGQVAPRAVYATGACAAVATSAQFGDALRGLSLLAGVAWCGQLFCLCLLASHLFVGSVVYASTAAVVVPVLPNAVAATVVVLALTVVCVRGIGRVLNAHLGRS